MIDIGISMVVIFPVKFSKGSHCAEIGDAHRREASRPGPRCRSNPASQSFPQAFRRFNEALTTLP
jgi:hypothetical protein